MARKPDKKLQSVLDFNSVKKDYLQAEPAGFIELDEGETVESVTQHSIADAVDVASAQKFFELRLDKFGPYKCHYTKNGRHLLLAGQLGHIATIDWQTKDLKCEFHVKETIHDIKWLHQETQFAVAQKQWTYIYDNQGIELHCLKMLDHVLRLEYLPNHFLLVSAHEKGYITWLDISIGKKVAGFGTGHGRLNVMCQNRSNAIIHLGHAAGTVTLWSPNVKEYLVKMKCHNSGVLSVAVDNTGNYMATSGMDRKLKLWDLRTYKVVQSYSIAEGASNLSFSQRGLLSASLGNTVQIYRDITNRTVTSPYLMYKTDRSVSSIQFCPYEDVLGVGHGHGFSSILIPGAGEPNYDALEANPYQTKQQRREAEVKSLLDKIQPSMITLDPDAIGLVNVKTLQEKLEEKSKLLFVKPKKIEFEPRYKKKGGSKAGKREKRRQGVILEEKLKEARHQAVESKRKEARSATVAAKRAAKHKTDSKPDKTGSKGIKADKTESKNLDTVVYKPVLDRFKKKLS